MKSYDEWISQENKKNFDRGKVMSKWRETIQNLFDNFNLNSEIFEYICFYAETYSIYQSLLLYPSYNLMDKLEEIKKSISELHKNKRVPIVRKVFNYETGHLEYELEDGNFAQILENGKIQPPLVNTMSILPKSFIRFIDPNRYRDEQIKFLLDENR